MNALSTLALCSLLLPASAVARADSQIIFAESYEKAFEEANERGVPLMICVIEDDEEANDDVWLNTINAPEFVKATQGTVNLLANRGTQEMHGVKEVEVDGKPRRLCAKFGTITCMDHVRMEIGVFRDFAQNGIIKTPQVMLILPDQTIVAALIDRHPMPDFLDAFKKASKQLPNGLSHEEVASVRQGLKDAHVWLEQGEIQKVIQFASPLASRESSSSLVGQAAAMMKRVEARGREELSVVEDHLKQKQYVPAMAMLEDLIQRYRRSIIEAEAKEQKVQLMKNREVKAALAAARREESARKLLETADALAEKGQDSRAVKLYERIRDRFADTEAGRELAERGSDENP